MTGGRDDQKRRRARARLEVIDQVRESSDSVQGPSTSAENVLPVDSEANKQSVEAVMAEIFADKQTNASAVPAEADGMVIDSAETINSDRKRKAGSSMDGSAAESDTESEYAVVVRNRYGALSKVTAEECEASDSIPASSSGARSAATPKSSAQQQTKKVPPPPPLKLHDIHNHNSLTKLVNKTMQGEYTIKYTSDGVIINVDKRENRQKLVEAFKEKNFNFHTYTDRLERTQNFVIRGLSDTITEQQISDFLVNTHGISVTRCNRMRTKHSPLFLVALGKEVDIHQLRGIKAIDHAKIQWERYTTKKRITQCRNCQMWGHAEANCYAAAKCGKCAGEHATTHCVADQEEPTLKCANCQGSHRANTITCPKFMDRKRWLDERARRSAPEPREARRAPPRNTSENFPPLRTFAPAPTVNPWTRGRTQTQQQQASTSMQQASVTNQRTETRANPIDAFQELGEQMRELNSLINLDEVLTQVKTLISLLQKSNSKAERMLIAVRFFAGLDG